MIGGGRPVDTTVLVHRDASDAGGSSVLDHGYVKLIETWGSDEGIVEAARMSTSKGFQGWGPKECDACVEQCTQCGGTGETPDVGFGSERCSYCPCKKCGGAGTVPGDEKFLKFLWDNKHHSPFEMAGASFEIQAPIFVFREWHRHRTQSYNEMSGRYTVLPDLCYLPSLERLMASKQAAKNKQGSVAGFTEGEAYCYRDDIKAAYEHSRASYQFMLDHGVAREIARLVIPVAQYSRMRASANLRNWLGFLTLRTEASAQWEIRQYANAVEHLLIAKFPRTMSLFRA